MRNRGLRGAALLAACCLLLQPTPLLADVTITEESEDLSTGETTTTRIFLGADRVRVENGADQAFMFRGDLDLFWIVDNTRGTYMELSAEDIERLGAQMSEVASQMAQIQAQLENMPAAQRRMIEQAMAGRGGIPGIPGLGAPEPPAVTEYRLVRAGEPVGSWSADLYEGTQSGMKRWEVWAAGMSEVDLSMADFAAFERLAEMMKSMAPSGQGMDELFQIQASADGPGYPGVPVRRVSYRDGEAETRYEMTQITRDPIASSMFELPEGLTRQEMPGF